MLSSKCVLCFVCIYIKLTCLTFSFLFSDVPIVSSYTLLIADQGYHVKTMNLDSQMENLAFAHRSREELHRVSDDVLK